MQLSEYIKQLTETLDTEGDHPVVQQGFRDVIVAREPKAAHMRILGKRESVKRIWQAFDGTESKGAKVILL